MSRYQRYFLIVVILAIAAGIVAWMIPISRGLDIAGGIRVTMQVAPRKTDDWPTDPAERSDKMGSIRDTILNRIKGYASEPRVVVQNATAPRPRVVVELPGVKDPEEALNTIKSTASLEFYYLKDVQNDNNPMGKWTMQVPPPGSKDNEYIFSGPRGETLSSVKDWKQVLEQVVDTAKNKPIVTGKDLLARAGSTLGRSGQAEVNLQFNNEGSAKFREFTRRHVGDYLAIFFDNKLLTAPTINEMIPNGQAQISGGFMNLEEATNLKNFLNAGSLPVPLKVIAKNSVEPWLGAETVHQVVFAGILGLVLVILFMVLYYRLPGAIASVALGLYALFVIAVFKLMHATMSLAGIAALVISIGMAVDANILIFERLKEELRSGKTLRAAIDAGFGRAFTAIFDSNMCTAITCGILLWYGTPAVQSFALTLLVGVAISMFTAITVTRTILHLLVGWEWAQSPNLYALSKGWFSENMSLNVVGKRAYYFLLSAVLIVPGIFFLLSNYFGPQHSFLRLGIEFKSGTSIQATFKQPVDLLGVRSVVSQYAKEYEVQLGKKGGQNKIAFIKTTPLTDTQENDLKDALNEKYQLATVAKNGQPRFDSVDKVEPTVSKELTTNAFIAVLLASAGIVLYLTGRFAIGGLSAGLKFGVCAVIALIHDSLFILGLFAMLGRFAGWEVDSLFVTAVLTIIGFSVHDTIVVYDRIRENLRHRLRGESFEELCNRSILQTFSRSINTSFTVVLTLTTLIIFGGPLLRHFYIALLAGIIIGTYSSIFNATPLVIVWEKMSEKAEPKKKAFEDKPLVERPMVTPPTTTTAPEATAETAEGEQVEEAPRAGDNGAAAKPGRVKRKTPKKKRF